MSDATTAAAGPGRAGAARLARAVVCSAAVPAFLLLASCSGPKAPPAVSSIAADDSATVFDHHVHVLSPALVEKWKSIGVPFSKPDYAYSDIDSILKFNPADGMFLVSMAYLWSTPAFSGDPARAKVARENDFVASLARKHPDRLFAFCGVDPLAAWAVDEVRRSRTETGAYGVKLHLSTSGVDLADPSHLARVREVFSAAAGAGMPVMLHLGAGAADDEVPGVAAGAAAAAGLLIDSVILPGPPVEVIVAHLGTSGGYTLGTRAIVRRFADALKGDAALSRRKVWFDISAVALTEGSEQAGALTPEDFADLSSDLVELGLARVVFGTDYPVFNAPAYLTALESNLSLTRGELIGIAGNGLPGSFGGAATRGD